MNTAEQELSESMILGFDPGRQKCGMAVLDQQFCCLFHEVVQTEDVIAKIQAICGKPALLGERSLAISTVVIGDQTSSKEWQRRLRTVLPDGMTIIPVDERYTSQDARVRYWQMYPPRGLCRLIPTGMRVPPRPIDDIVAILLAERYLTKRSAQPELKR